MHYYLASPVQQPRPDGLSWSPPLDIKGDWSALYLLEGDVTGSMLVASDHRHWHRLLDYLGDSLDGRSRWLRRRLATRLGIDLEADTLRGAVAEILLIHGSYRDPTRWNPLQAEADGWHRIYLRGLIYEAPAIVAATQTEAFTRGSDENLETSSNWSLNEGTAGALRVIASTDDADSNAANDPAVYKYNSDVSTNDTYCQIDLTVMNIDTGSPKYNQVGPMVSVDSSQATGLFFMRQLYDSGSGDTATYNIRKSVNDSRSDLTSETTLALSLPETLKISRSGNSIKGYIDSVQKDSVTDSSVTATATGGIYTYINTTTNQQHTIDNWELGDFVDVIEVAGTTDGDSTSTGHLPAVFAASSDGDGVADWDFDVILELDAHTVPFP